MNERRHGKHSARKTSSIRRSSLGGRRKPPENGEGVFLSSPMSISSRRERGDEEKSTRGCRADGGRSGRGSGERNIKGSVSSASLSRTEFVRGGVDLLSTCVRSLKERGRMMRSMFTPSLATQSLNCQQSAAANEGRGKQRASAKEPRCN